ncbi:MAG: ribonuclease, partial [Deltaproteobacteria bacterium]|nr:ribonuclease [Deltaproteobacteria bacterium]
RQHLGLNILRGSYKECPICQGSGLVRSTETTSLDYLRKIWTTLVHKRPAVLKAVLPADAADYLLNRKRAEIANLEDTYKASIIIESSAAALSHEGYIETTPHELQT